VSSGSVDDGQPRPTVFMSYASEDRVAARQIGHALAANGLETWFDESELGGGDAWDQKIRRQIRDCDYFMALISAQTEARHEGYFRREWRLAVERTLDMADDHTFLLPVVIDDTSQDGARVPEKFLSVQWLKLPDGKPTPSLEALCRRLTSPQPAAPASPRKPSSRPRAANTGEASYPEFPREEPGQRMRFWAAVIGWLFRSGWIAFKRWPRWLRLMVSVWLAVVVLSRGCTPNDHEPRQVSRTEATKLKTIADQYKGSSNTADIAKLGAQVAREFQKDEETSADRSPLLAVPFTAAAGDTTGAKLADSTFAEVYGRVSIAHPGHVGLTKSPLPSREFGAALERARAAHSSYVLFGTVETVGSAQILTIKIGEVADASTVWSKSYPASGVDPAKIAAEVNSNIPTLDDD
jgi:TolB-like protein